MEILFLIPARGGSKGIPHKNIKLLNGKPLIHYSLDTAKAVNADNKEICVSTDDDKIIEVVKEWGHNILFKRPAELATDKSSSRDVILHALEYYRKFQNRNFDIVVLLQPTSPFRKVEDIQNMLDLYHPDIDMLVSVKESEENPYYSLYEEDSIGNLIQSKEGNYTRRQDCPQVYTMNGSVYIINVKAILTKDFSAFTKTRKYLMANEYSVDIDSPLDWLYSEMLIQHKLV